jgi:hypothetical protein
MPELDGNGTVAAEKHLPELDNAERRVGELDAVGNTTVLSELETRGNAAELHATSRHAPGELPDQPIRLG